MPSLVTLLPFVFELSSKTHRGGKMTPHPPPGRGLMRPKAAGSSERISVGLGQIRLGSKQAQTSEICRLSAGRRLAGRAVVAVQWSGTPAAHPPSFVLHCGPVRAGDDATVHPERRAGGCPSPSSP